MVSKSLLTIIAASLLTACGDARAVPAPSGDKTAVAVPATAGAGDTFTLEAPDGDVWRFGAFTLYEAVDGTWQRRFLLSGGGEGGPDWYPIDDPPLVFTSPPNRHRWKLVLPTRIEAGDYQVCGNDESACALIRVG